MPTPGAMVPAQLVLEQAIGAVRGDRLILRNATANRTIGGGVVRDPYPSARGWRRPERLASLAALAMTRSPAAPTELLRILPAGVDFDRFVLAAGMTPREA
jgi:selenocysteine-specific elongation factor